MPTNTPVNNNSNGRLGAPYWNNLRTRGVYFHDFNVDRLVLANASIGVAGNLDWELAGTSASSALNAGGFQRLTTNSAGGAEASIFPHQDSNQTLLNTIAWDLSDGAKADWLIGLPASLAAISFFIGFKLTTTLNLTTDANQAFFYSNNGGAWQLATSIGGSDALNPLGVTPSANSLVRLTLLTGYTDADGDEAGRCFINGQGVGGLVKLPTTGALKPIVGVVGNAQSVDIYGGQVAINSR